MADAIRSTMLDKPFQSSSGEGIVPSFSRTSPVVLISLAIGMMLLTSDSCSFCNQVSMVQVVF